MILRSRDWMIGEDCIHNTITITSITSTSTTTITTNNNNNKFYVLGGNPF